MACSVIQRTLWSEQRAVATSLPLFFPSEPGNSLTYVEFSSLLVDYQAALADARTATGWNQQKLNQIVAQDYGFLGPFISARIETVMQEAGSTAEFLVVEFRPPHGRNLDKAERLFQKATGRADRGDVRGALPDLKRLVAHFPEVPKYHQTLGLAYLELDELEAAEDELLRALRLDPRLEAALTLLANVYQRRGNLELAIPLYRRSIELHPTVHAMSNLGAVLAQTGDLPQAIPVLEAATRVDPAFPKAWYGLGLALYKTGDPARFPNAMDALDKTLAALGERKREATLWDTTRQLLNHVTQAAAQATLHRAQEINEAVAQAEAAAGGLPVRREETPVSGVLAKFEYGWVHNRPYHRLLVDPNPRVEREAFVRHELEHLRLVNLARAAHRNRWFVSTDDTQATMTKALHRDVGALRQRGLPPERLQPFIQQVTSGVLTQLYNTPVDLLIEARILEAHPALDTLVYLSVKAQLEQGLQAAEDPQIRQHTPRAIFRANVAMNGAFAAWFEARWPRRTDLPGRYQRMEAWPLAQRLYADWKASAAQWTPGAEYDWVDRWADLLGITGWYGWIDGNGAPAAPSAPPPTKPETFTPMAEAEQMAYLHYLLGALEWLDREGLARAREVAAEIAALGTGGIDFQGDRTYTLRSLPGKEFSGRHVVSFLYVCLKAIDPTGDPGIDLLEPYLRALELHQGRRGGA